MSTNQTIEQKIQAVKKNYLNTLPQKISAIQQDWSILQSNWSENIFKDFHLKIHNIVGTGATFGFPKLSEAAKELQNAIDLLIPNKEANAMEKKQIQLLLDNLVKVSQDCESELK